MTPGYKKTAVGAIPVDWEVACLNDFSRIIRGASPRPKGDSRFYGGPVPRLTVEDVTRDGKTVFPQIDSLTIEGAKRSRPCKRGTLTLVCSGTVGIPSFLGVDACIHDGFIAIVDIQRSVSSDYLYYQLERLRLSFESSATHGGIFTNLTTAGVREFNVPLPLSVVEQCAIASALSDVDALLSGLDRLIAKKRDLKQAAMQQLLTGQARLPGFNGAWDTKRLGAVADVIDPHPSHRAPDVVANGVPFVGIGDLDESGNIVGNRLRIVGTGVLDEHATRYNLADDLIGLGRVASIGKVVALKKLPERYAISPTLGVIRGRETKGTYLLYACPYRFKTDQVYRLNFDQGR